MGKFHEAGNKAAPQEAASFISECDRLEQDRENRLAQLDADFKREKRALNKSVNSDIMAICNDAKKVGLAKGMIKVIVASQKRMRKHEEALESAKDMASVSINAMEDDRDYAISIIQALGDDFAGFGLGAVAVEKANGKTPEPDAAAIADEMARQDAAGAAKH